MDTHACAHRTVMMCLDGVILDTSQPLPPLAEASHSLTVLTHTLVQRHPMLTIPVVPRSCLTHCVRTHNAGHCHCYRPSAVCLEPGELASWRQRYVVCSLYPFAPSCLDSVAVCVCTQHKLKCIHSPHTTVNYATQTGRCEDGGGAGGNKGGQNRCVW